MGVANFVTVCDASSEAFKTATLLKTLSVNSLITGEVAVGKRSLAKYILPDASIIDASNIDELLVALESSKEIIIINLETSPNIKKTIEAIKHNDVRVIATAKSQFYNELVDDVFSVKFDIPPLSQRPGDVELLTQRFIKEASELFDGDIEFNNENFKPDLSQNSASLRRQVTMLYLLQDIKDVELMDIIENYLYDRLGSNSDYRKFLYLYEAPLIKAGLSKFKSQLKLSDKLGLNRNTLRKKIAENSQYLQG